VDTDGDGTDELLLGRPGELLSMPADRGASPRSLLGPNQLGVMVPRVHGGDFIVDRTTRTLAIATSGALRFFRFNRFNSVAATGELEQVAEVPMPPASSVAGSGANMRLVLQQAGPRFVGHDAAGGALFTSAPVLAGGQRIGATLIVPGASADVPGQIEWWARLPSPERLIESFLRTLDGEPVVVVTSMPADRFSLFGEKRLRVLPLRGDRTRSGHPPLLAVETGANLWQDAQLFVYDVDGDGRSDLLFGYWKGLKDTTIALEAYLRREDGSFAPRPIKMQFDIEGGDRKQIGVVPAPGRTTGSVLLALSEAGLVTLPLRTLERGRGKLVDVGGARVFPLAAGVTSGGRLGIPAGSQPDRLVLPHERASTLPQVVDLDGDGAREIVVRAPATAAWPVSVLKLH
jgi:hypothetical protein